MRYCTGSSDRYAIPFARTSNNVKGPMYFGANFLVLPGLIGRFLVDSITLLPILSVNCFRCLLTVSALLALARLVDFLRVLLQCQVPEGNDLQRCFLIVDYRLHPN